MTEYSINRGIGRKAEFNGLTSMYLFIFAGGLLSVFVVFVILYMAGISTWGCIAFGAVSSLILVYGTFYLNGRYGEHGLMKAQARRCHPRYVINRRQIPLLFTPKKKNV